MIWPWTKKRIKGIVDVFSEPTEDDPYTLRSVLYDFKSFSKITNPEKWGEAIRGMFVDPVGPYVIRTNWNENPEEYVVVPPEWERFIRMGDLVEGFIRGNKFTLETVNGRVPIDKNERTLWLKQGHGVREVVGAPIFTGKYGRLLKLLHAAPGRGDGGFLIAAPEVGKSTFLSLLLGEVDPQLEVIVVLAERPEERIDFLKKLRGVSGKFKFFIAHDQESPLRRLCNIGLAMQYAMRRAEEGRAVLVVVDSLTKALTKAINGLPPLPGVGIAEGGVNPLLAESITTVVSTRGNYGWASLTFFAALLDEADIRTHVSNLLSRGSGTGEITLSMNFSKRGIYPAILLSLVESSGKNSSVSVRSSFFRRQADWMRDTPELLQACLRMQDVMSFEKSLEDEIALARNSSGPGYRFPNQVELELLAWNRTAEKLRVLLDLVEKDVSDYIVFKEFGIPLPKQEIAFAWRMVEVPDIPIWSMGKPKKPAVLDDPFQNALDNAGWKKEPAPAPSPEGAS